MLLDMRQDKEVSTQRYVACSLLCSSDAGMTYPTCTADFMLKVILHNSQHRLTFHV